MQRVSYHLLKDGRIPIFENLTLNVSTYSNDHSERLSLQSPFVTPQAALDWAIANCDFRNVETLTINMEGSSSYDGLANGKTIVGIERILFTGMSEPIASVSILTGNVVEFTDITIKPEGSQTALRVTNSYVLFGRNITVSRTVASAGIYIFRNGVVSTRNLTRLTMSGRFGAMLHLSSGGSSVPLTLSGTVTGAMVTALDRGHVHIIGATLSGTVTGKRYDVNERSTLRSGGILNNIPGNVGGTANTSSRSN